MTISNTTSGTNVHEIAEGIYRINTPVAFPDGSDFSYNQYLIVDDEPMLFHTGHRKMFSLVQEAVASILPLHQLRYIGFSHVEGDECGALNEWLAVAPQASPVCSQIAAMTSINDMADRPARPLADGELLLLGQHSVRWFNAPHLPHGWECGYLLEEKTRTLLCGDLFTQPGKGEAAVTESDILAPSEAFRRAMDYFSHAPNSSEILGRLAATQPQTLACMHGSAWQGDGASLLRALARSLAQAN